MMWKEADSYRDSYPLSGKDFGKKWEDSLEGATPSVWIFKHPLGLFLGGLQTDPGS